MFSITHCSFSRLLHCSLIALLSVHRPHSNMHIRSDLHPGCVMCLGLFHCASHRVWSSTESYLYKMGTQRSQAGHKRKTPYNSFPVPVTTITMVATAHVPPPINPNPLPAGPPKFGRVSLLLLLVSTQVAENPHRPLSLGWALLDFA